MDTTALDDVHAFWFGPLASPDAVPFDKVPMWFGATPEIDEAIRARFGAWIDPAASENWDLAELTPRQQLGLIVLLDQMTRNVHRGSPLTYQHDVRARQVSLTVLALGLEPFGYIERMFAVLPLGHSESLGDQEVALGAFRDHIQPFIPAAHDFWTHAARQADHHREVIARFGRFPHRNALLGRVSTPEEVAFLAAEAGR